MFRRLKNNKGFFPIDPSILIPVIAGTMALMTSVGFVKTAMNGVLQKNGKVIWCKMKGTGNDVCDSMYGHLGNAQYVNR